MSYMDNLEQLPYGAFTIQDGAVSSVNTAAQSQLPILVPGAHLPEAMLGALSQGDSAGTFTWEEQSFFFTRVDSPDSRLILFRPDQSGGISAAQLDGFSRRMREQLGAFFNQLQLISDRSDPQADGADQIAGLNQSFHRILHLVNDLEFLNIPTKQADDLFCPVCLDLSRLCAELYEKTAPAAKRIGVTLHHTPVALPVLIPGDPALLERMALCLISNGAKAAPGGVVWLGLQLRNDRAVLTVCDSGNGEVDLSRLTPDPDRIPTPDEGAGMGLDVARRIAKLHNGTLLTAPGANGGLICAVSLPTGPLPTAAPLNAPRMETDGGISTLLTELSDLLPTDMFRPDFD